jgi:hypothetical protein
LVVADGTVESESRTLLELEDVARRYRHPSIIDVKVRRCWLGRGLLWECTGRRQRFLLVWHEMARFGMMACG